VNAKTEVLRAREGGKKDPISSSEETFRRREPKAQSGDEANCSKKEETG